MSWYYEVVGPNGGAGGDAYKSVFNGSGKDPAATLSREAVQNSVDAARDPGGNVRVDFRFSRLSGQDFKNFFEAASLGQMSPRLNHLGLVSHNCLSKSANSMELLYVEDYGTTGLEGDVTHPSSNLRKLLMDLGGSGKSKFQAEAPNQGRGGSYGFGKAVYSSNSKIGTIFAFSRTTDKNGEPITVLMGSAYQSEHEAGGLIHTGRAWLGKQTQTDQGLRFDPFVGDEAEKLAKALGFDRDDGLGTSILIIDTEVNPDHLLEGLEDNWWPRMQMKRLDVEIITESGAAVVPQPRRRVHLKPFIQAWDVASGAAPEEAAERKQFKYNRIPVNDPEPRKLTIGKLGLVSLDQAEDDCPLGEKYDDDLVNTIALIRSPMMVVSYHKTGRNKSVLSSVVGCFIADPEIDEILRLSEPPPHDDWDPSAQRLKTRNDAYPDVVKSVLDRIKKSFKEFQRSASPPDSPHKRSLLGVERTLSQWFGPNKGNPSPPPSSSPIHLVPDEPKLALDDDGRLIASGAIKISIGASALEKGIHQIPVQFDLSLKVGEEDGVSSKDPIPFTLEIDRGDLALVSESENKSLWQGYVTKNKPIKVSYRSIPYDPSWTLKVVPVVTEAPSENST